MSFCHLYTISGGIYGFDRIKSVLAKCFANSNTKRMYDTTVALLLDQICSSANVSTEKCLVDFFSF